MSSKDARLARMIRVDHAGEYGAVAIHRGQKAVLSRQQGTRTICEWITRTEAEEQKHLDAFDAMIQDRGVRPTLLSPLWNLAGYSLGAATALMGEGYAYACIEAVEEVIEDHYDRQLAVLETMGEAELAARFGSIRDDESAHRREAARGARAPEAFKACIRFGCRMAIAVSKRI